MHQNTTHTKEVYTKIRNHYFRSVKIKSQEYFKTKFAINQTSDQLGVPLISFSAKLKQVNVAP